MSAQNEQHEAVASGVGVESVPRVIVNGSEPTHDTLEQCETRGTGKDSLERLSSESDYTRGEPSREGVGVRGVLRPICSESPCKGVDTAVCVLISIYELY